MDGVGAGDLAGGQQAWNVEIALRRWRRADADAFIGKAHVHGIGIGGGMHGDGGDADLSAGAQHTQRDLAAIGNQHLVEHRCAAAPGYSMMTSGSPNSTGWPLPTRMAVTVPAFGAGMWFMVFMASMIRMVCPCATRPPTSMKGAAPGSGAR